jgi:hypothetical protein
MKSKYLILVIAIPFMAILLSCNNQSGEINIESLLREMTDREHIAKFPNPEFTTKQFSSYNIASEKPGDYTWFANLDNNYFLRTEENEGRREFVLFDAEGPGTVVRFWATFARYDREGILRFYFDGEDTPRIEGEGMEILSGGGLVESPLSFSVSEDCDYSRRGHNLYLPIPYSSHLKITYESDGIPEARDGIDEVRNPTIEMFYYQINYRSYYPGIQVESFSLESLETYKDVIKETQKKILERDRGLDDIDLETETFSDKLAPGAEKLITVEGGRAIRMIQLKLDADDLEQALRSTVIKASFDGEQTIWAPVGDFFGAGYKNTPADTWYQKVSPDGTLQVFWIMPFKKKCELALINYGSQDVDVSDGEVSSSKWKWDGRSMYFGSSWYQNTRINTGINKDINGQGDMYDIKYTRLNGQGVYVGDGVTLFNCSTAWWGEGDEKIFVDNEEFPSHFGTGTEDYYGYAWCRPESFIHPFISQPDGTGNLGIGYTLNMRFRCLDVIPFKERLQFDMEMWHHGYTIINHAPVTFWYIRPEGECEIPEDIEGVKEEVVLHREQIFPPVMNEDNIIEGEDMVLISITGEGTARMRSIPVPDKPNWTRAAQMWTGATAGDEITFKFIVSESGRYGVKAAILSRADRARVSFVINGKTLLTSALSNKTNRGDIEIDLKSLELQEGDNELKLLIHELQGTGNLALGVDYLKFNKL